MRRRSWYCPCSEDYTNRRSSSNASWENAWSFRDGTRRPWSKCSTLFPTAV